MLRVNQLTGFGVVRSGVPSATGVEFLATMTTNSAPSPQVASANSILAPYDSWRAFDKANASVTDCWSSALGTSAWLAVDVGAATVLWSYSVAAINHSPFNSSPTAWTLEGSDNGSSWTVVDTRSGVTGWTQAQVRTYTLSAGVIFRHYRINVTAVDGGSYVQIGELRLFS